MKVKVEMTPEEMITAVNCYEELKAYRATGYKPEQVQELHDKHWMECMQIARYDDELNGNRGWIPCSERLPEGMQEVLVFTELRKVEKALYNCAYKSFDRLESDGYRKIENVIRWMPLPEPPAEEKTE